MPTTTPKVTVVTGAASGIGLAIAQRLADADHELVLIDRSESIHEVAAGLTEAAGARGFVADLADRSDIERVTAEISAAYGGVDILVNNAGIHPKKPDGGHFPMNEISLEQWDLVMAVNVTAVFLLSNWALESMKERGWGRIVNIASRAGRMYLKNVGVHYAASKAAVIGFTRNLAGEAGPYNVTANTVAPGRIKTPLSDKGGDSGVGLHGQFASTVPLNRIGRPDELANAVAFLASEESSFITGSVIDVNGGAFG